MGPRKKSKVGLTGGLGVRYGVRSRRRYNEILLEMRKNHLCPQCNSKSVRRASIGIWCCAKCDLKYAGGAYVPETKVGETAKRASTSRRRD